MNWGKGIIIGMAIFIVFIVGMCIYMFQSPTDDFDHQYYEKGLSFDHDYDREKQVANDHTQPTIAIDNKQILFAFVQAAKGTIKFIRPSSTTADKVFTINTDSNNQMSLPITNFALGKWQIVFEWTSGSKAYLYQQEIYIK